MNTKKLVEEVLPKTKEKGLNSRMKKTLIEGAIKNCNPEDRFNRFKICEQLVYIMYERYPGKNLEYHSNRMGMGSTSKILREIDNYFYRDYKNEN